MRAPSIDDGLGSAPGSDGRNNGLPEVDMSKLLCAAMLAGCTFVMSPGCDRARQTILQNGGAMLAERNAAATGLRHGSLAVVRLLANAEGKTRHGQPAVTVDALQELVGLASGKFLLDAAIESKTHLKSLVFRGVTVTTTGLEAGARSTIVRLVQEAGGKYQANLNSKTTHLVAEEAVGKKIEAAAGLPCVIVTPQWIHVSVARNVRANETDYKLRPLTGTVVCCTGLDAAERATFEEKVSRSGGKWTADLVRRVTHLLALEPRGDKFAHAASWDVPVIKPEWVDASIRAGYQVSVEAFRVSNAPVRDMYLDSCTFYLVGFDKSPRVFHEMLSLVREAGATRLSFFNADRVTHVIVGPDVSDTSTLDAKLFAVPVLWAAWLAACRRATRKLQPAPQHYISAAPQPGTDPSVLSAVSELQKVFRNPRGRRTKPLAGQRIWKHERAVVDDADMECLKDLGAQVAERRQDASVVIVPWDFCFSSHFDPEIVRTRILVTRFWVAACAQDRRAVDPSSRFSFRPVMPERDDEHALATAASALRSVKLSITNVDNDFGERDCLDVAAEILGADVSADFRKSCTHLVCGKPTGSKYQAARRWNIPCVSVKWLLDQAWAGKRLDDALYAIEDIENDDDRAAASSASAPARLPLAGRRVVFAKGTATRENRDLATRLGAIVTTERAANADYIVCTTRSVPRDPAAPVVSVHWLAACMQHNAAVDHAAFPPSFDPNMSLSFVSTDQPSNESPESPEPADHSGSLFAEFDPDLALLADDPTAPAEPPRRREATPILGNIVAKAAASASRRSFKPEPVALPPSAKRMRVTAPESSRADADEDEDEDAVEYGESRQPWTPHSGATAGAADEQDLAYFMQVQNSATQSIKPQPAAPKPRPTFVFQLTGFSEDLRRSLSRDLESLNGRVVESTAYDRECTHLIAARPVMSEKFLSAIAGGRWILGQDYVAAVLRAGSLTAVDEIEHELKADDENGRRLVNAARRWRLADRPPFHDFRVVLLLARARINGFTHLLRAGGGIIIKPPLNQHVGVATHAILDPQGVEKHTPATLAKLGELGISCVVQDYLVEFLLSDRPPDVDRFRV